MAAAVPAAQQQQQQQQLRHIHAPRAVISIKVLSASSVACNSPNGLHHIVHLRKRARRCTRSGQRLIVPKAASYDEVQCSARWKLRPQQRPDCTIALLQRLRPA
eukprot:TRINITY_DN312_c0_g1_i1.p2 TRINITY_DN312_c0_g1~~TRINITY_DN312_c0_g1_i1.p2  ORF type:complete len:104 (+),score=17.91 TRINITY_DN312_c0_g1_i1:251-562(+)